MKIHSGDPRRSRRLGGRRLGAAAISGLLTAGLLSACGGGKPVLNWYINPDGQETLTSLAEACSTDDYDIEIQLLPSGATDQRTQLARRLAASDSSTDLMSLDPVFVPEFANAGWLEELPDDVATKALDGVLDGPAETVKWDDGVYAFPQWANTQVLWYRKSLAEKAGLDMTKPVTWDEIIKAAAANDATVGIQGNKYEAYVVLINSLLQGAPADDDDAGEDAPRGAIVTNPEDGKDATVSIDSDAGRKAAAIIQELADSEAAQSDLSVSNEGTSLPQMFPEDGAGEFMTNWTFVYGNYKPGDANDFTQEQFDDLGYARYPRTVPDQSSRPPVGGIDIGVGAFSKHPEWALDAAACVTTEDAQTQLAANDALMPSRAEAYDAPEVTEAFPADLLALWQESLDAGGVRPKSAYYALISQAVQSRWHAPTSVDPDTTPEESAKFLQEVLDGKALL